MGWLPQLILHLGTIGSARPSNECIICTVRVHSFLQKKNICIVKYLDFPINWFGVFSLTVIKIIRMWCYIPLENSTWYVMNQQNIWIELFKSKYWNNLHFLWYCNLFRSTCTLRWTLSTNVCNSCKYREFMSPPLSELSVKCRFATTLLNDHLSAGFVPFGHCQPTTVNNCYTRNTSASGGL